MDNRIFLWNDRKSPETGNIEDDFQPYMELSLIENAPKPLGLVVILPGGGYRGRAQHEGMPIAQKFNALGFHAAVVQYRVSPYIYPAPQQDALRAIAIVRANAEKWNVDPDHIAIGGSSAGGHLAACCGTIAEKIDRTAGDEADQADCRPNALVLSYPVISGNPAICHPGSFQRLSGKETPDQDFLEFVSLEKQIKDDTPPAFLWHTATDQGVNVENSILFARAMWKKEKTAELHIYPQGRHGLGLAEDHSDIRTWPELAANFLEKTGFPRNK